ncbi:sigma-70 family RNA polymerase sigma factor [Paenibacillus sp. GCM10027626]|uniref:sigma-70 family RNA polymerase sigma factor n=1 Tax=Paenibacillus sp. GCM10027626 TaxID=3273411 RepID=UPI003638FDF4
MLEWIEEAKQGNHAAFGRLVRKFFAMAYVVAYEQLHDVYMAEDAVQEAMMEAFMHLQQLQDPEAFPGWLKVIVIRQCHRFIRKKRHQAVPLNEALHAADHQSDVHEIAERRDRHRQLYASIAALSDNLRIVVQLFYFEGYSLQEISAFLGISVSGLKKRLSDARNKLRGALAVADFVSVFSQLYEGGQKMLHIVNGDTVGDKLRAGVVEGDILVWREVYSEGPVFTDGAVPSNRQVRARYLENAMGIPYDEFVRTSEAQERILADFKKYDDIVLWFEHDLFDQTMLCFLLHWFSGQSLGKTRLHLLCIGDFPEFHYSGGWDNYLWSK